MKSSQKTDGKVKPKSNVKGGRQRVRQIKTKEKQMQGDTLKMEMETKTTTS